VSFGSVLVRVKRWCKRPPAPGVTQVARQTPPGARSRRAGRLGDGPAQAFEGGPPESAGRPHEPAGDGRPRWMVAGRDSAARRRGHRTRRIGRLVRRLPSDRHGSHVRGLSSGVRIRQRLRSVGRVISRPDQARRSRRSLSAGKVGHVLADHWAKHLQCLADRGTYVVSWPVWWQQGGRETGI
jgi:hypothetical protein